MEPGLENIILGMVMITTLAGLIIAALIFMALVNVLRVALRTAIFVTLIIVGVSLAFGISSGSVWDVVWAIWTQILNYVTAFWDWAIARR